MVRRILILVAALAASGAAISFASGQKDVAPGAAAANGPSLTLTGQLSFQNLVHPTLKSGGTTYLLLVPRVLVSRAGLKEGATVSVEGYKPANLPRFLEVPDGVTVLVVTKATIDGKDYDVTQIERQMAARLRGMRGWRGYGRRMMPPAWMDGAYPMGM